MGHLLQSEMNTVIPFYTHKKKFKKIKILTLILAFDSRCHIWGKQCLLKAYTGLQTTCRVMFGSTATRVGHLTTRCSIISQIFGYVCVIDIRLTSSSSAFDISILWSFTELSSYILTLYSENYFYSYLDFLA